MAEEILALFRARNLQGAGAETREALVRLRAVLYRSNSQSRLFEESLRLLNVPLPNGRGVLLPRPEGEAQRHPGVLETRELNCPHMADSSMRRILNWPPRGISTRIQHRPRARICDLSTGLLFTEALKQTDKIPELKDKSLKGIQALESLLDELHARSSRRADRIRDQL